MTYTNGAMKLNLLMIVRDKALFEREDGALILAYKPDFDESNNTVIWASGSYHCSKEFVIQELTGQFKNHLEEVINEL